MTRYCKDEIGGVWAYFKDQEWGPFWSEREARKFINKFVPPEHRCGGGRT